jgi:hypothetical protein
MKSRTERLVAARFKGGSSRRQVKLRAARLDKSRRPVHPAIGWLSTAGYCVQQ